MAQANTIVTLHKLILKRQTHPTKLDGKKQSNTNSQTLLTARMEFSTRVYGGADENMWRSSLQKVIASPMEFFIMLKFEFSTLPHVEEKNRSLFSNRIKELRRTHRHAPPLKATASNWG